ncbi:peroxiredoxin (alkyl hydroperoxide reductase subunit C) [Caldithrix abyssi DSM 13497]|nr:peroxiredoxin (alkyl hydroperoxide reductase subunit C) [Caldithrix abyssi DSM 13497]
MPDNSFKEDFKLEDYRGKYVVVFFYPLDFTFVCPTEILEFNKFLPEFEKRNVQVIGVSTDSHFSHLAWKNTDLKDGGIGNIKYPLVSDFTKQISRDYGVLIEEDGVALRGSFLIDKEGILQHAVINNLSLGRNIKEMIRMVDALQHFEKYGEVCPADWEAGKEAMKASPDGVKEFLSKHADEFLG